VIYLTTEVSRLNDNLADAQADAELWRKKYDELESNTTNQIEEYRVQFNMMKRSSIGA
jgi:hypothetical protein